MSSYYKLKRPLPGLPEGVVFTLNDKTGKYECGDWGLVKEIVETKPLWFEKVEEEK